MTDDDMNKQLDDGQALFEAFRQISDLLNGAVRTLVADGWTEQQSREVVVATYLNNIWAGRR